jgi:hypothetical protein
MKLALLIWVSQLSMLSNIAMSLRANGPFQVPFLGSVDFLLRLLKKQPLPEILREYRCAYGDVIHLKTGPINQYWVTAPESPLASQLLHLKSCSGRSQLKEPSFGDDFLFLTRDLERAREIRKKQGDWLRLRASPRKIAETVKRVFPDIKVALSSAATAAGREGALWDQTAFGRLSVRALLGTMIGGPSAVLHESTGWKEGWLSDNELDELLELTEAYRRRTPRPNTRKGLGKMTRESTAEAISSLLKTALQRCCKEDDVVRNQTESLDLIPILVSAIVGGAEIYPLLLFWTVRHLAVSPGLQNAIRRECATIDDGEYGSFVKRVVSHISYIHPYSAALGPPRKITQDTSVMVNIASPGQPQNEQEVILAKEAILFITHPALFSDWSDRFPRGSSISEVSAMRSSESAAISEVMTSTTDRLPMFGLGERSCIASEMSISFLSSFICALVSEYEVSIDSKNAKACSISDLFHYIEDGSLLFPRRMDLHILLSPLRPAD